VERIEAVPRVDATEAPSRVAQKPSLPLDPAPDKEKPREWMARAVESHGEGPLARSGPESAELVIGSKAAAGSGQVEHYAKIRIDPQTREVLIQIVDAAKGEVIREIPPGASSKMESNFQLPKGIFVEEKR